jgi:hypothetical protein
MAITCRIAAGRHSQAGTSAAVVGLHETVRANSFSTLANARRGAPGVT